MKLSENAVSEFNEIFAQEYGIFLTRDEAEACGFRGDRAHHSEEFPPGIPI